MTDTAAQEISGHARSVACDGGGGPLGHPKVFLELDKDGKVCCPYCSRRVITSYSIHYTKLYDFRYTD